MNFHFSTMVGMTANTGIAACFNGGNAMLTNIIPANVLPGFFVVPINVLCAWKTGSKF